MEKSRPKRAQLHGQALLFYKIRRAALHNAGLYFRMLVIELSAGIHCTGWETAIVRGKCVAGKNETLLHTT